MPSNKPQIKAYIDQVTYEKFKTLAEQEHRSTSNYIEMLVSREIENYENKHGNIKINMLKNDGTIHNVNM
ncbi:hypothetical protein [Roseburia inulinivorans]